MIARLPSSLLSIDFQIYDYTDGNTDATHRTYYSIGEALLRNALKVDKSTWLSRVSYFSTEPRHHVVLELGDFNARKDDSQ